MNKRYFLVPFAVVGASLSPLYSQETPPETVEEVEGVAETEVAADKSPAQALAEAHGLQNWNDVSILEFTFTVAFDPPVVRKWKWEVADQTVTRTVDGESMQIDLEAIEGDEAKEVHQQFINDTFWLLFPFQLVWSSPTVTDGGMTEVEIDGEPVEAQKLTALWPDDEGYTPGDAYDLYLGDNNKILAWTFRKANAEEGKRFIWKNEKRLGPLRYTEDYHLEGSDEPFISMKDLRLKVKDIDGWILPTELN